MELEEIYDMFGLWHRIKEIRPSYKLYLNKKTGKAELHDTNFGGKCMEFDFPLSPQIIDKINATKIENSNFIFRKIEEKNSKKQQKSIQNAVDYAKYTLNQTNFLGENYVK